MASRRPSYFDAKTTSIRMHGKISTANRLGKFWKSWVQGLDDCECSYDRMLRTDSSGRLVACAEAAQDLIQGSAAGRGADSIPGCGAATLNSRQTMTRYHSARAGE